MTTVENRVKIYSCAADSRCRWCKLLSQCSVNMDVDTLQVCVTDSILSRWLSPSLQLLFHPVCQFCFSWQLAALRRVIFRGWRRAEMRAGFSVKHAPAASSRLVSFCCSVMASFKLQTIRRFSDLDSTLAFLKQDQDHDCVNRNSTVLRPKLNYSVSQKTSPTFLSITWESIVGFSSYLAHVLPRK